MWQNWPSSGRIMQRTSARKSDKLIEGPLACPLATCAIACCAGTPLVLLPLQVTLRHGVHMHPQMSRMSPGRVWPSFPCATRGLDGGAAFAVFTPLIWPWPPRARQRGGLRGIPALLQCAGLRAAVSSLGNAGRAGRFGSHGPDRPSPNSRAPLLSTTRGVQASAATGTGRGLNKICVACVCAVRPMPRCVSFIIIVDHCFGSRLGHHHQYDYKCNSTGTNIVLFYFGMAIFSLPGVPDMQFAMTHIHNFKWKQG